jgi:hypothetical protein
MQDRPKNLEFHAGSGGFPHHWMRGWPSPQKGCRDFLARWATSRFGVEFGSAAWVQRALWQVGDCFQCLKMGYVQWLPGLVDVYKKRTGKSPYAING